MAETWFTNMKRERELQERIQQLARERDCWRAMYEAERDG